MARTAWYLVSALAWEFFLPKACIFLDEAVPWTSLYDPGILTAFIIDGLDELFCNVFLRLALLLNIFMFFLVLVLCGLLPD
jgi:hypothetical protein